MVTNTGYRQMLRDRTPKVVILALKWCKAQEKWLDHVYGNWIWIYSSKKERLAITRNILGLDKKPRQFNFEGTILWDNLTVEEKESWESIAKWVSWFQENHAYIKNTYDISKKTGKDITEIKLNIMSTYLRDLCPTNEDSKKERTLKSEYVNKLCDFLIDSFENQIK